MLLLLFAKTFWYLNVYRKYQVSLAVLIIDPLYMSVLCDLFGGGDMNGIVLILPEIPTRIVFAIFGVLHAIVILKYLRPEYTRAFQEEG